ncbi:hypothetical protein T10_355 [Trichinella papuae]|uniref:Uncharacterized protein n=1 Tax=Trichinella papuae TaxID=268474 RepID=A0A0V1M1E8_9BILA|nr:hypothetical protein T10_355 [Trichinella papuae]
MIRLRGPDSNERQIGRILYTQGKQPSPKPTLQHRLTWPPQEWTEFNLARIQFRLRRNEVITPIVTNSQLVLSGSARQKENRHRKKTKRLIGRKSGFVTDLPSQQAGRPPPCCSRPGRHCPSWRYDRLLFCRKTCNTVLLTPTTINHNTTDSKPKPLITTTCLRPTVLCHRSSGPNVPDTVGECNGVVVHDQLSLSSSYSVDSGI